MPLQDLTPQLRTRLNQVERAVGWFVFFAAVLLLFGFGYYIYHTAERKGWFVEKAEFRTYLQSSAGLKVGDQVLMMGSPVGQITKIFPMPPDDRRNVQVDFEIRAPDFRHPKMTLAGRKSNLPKLIRERSEPSLQSSQEFQYQEFQYWGFYLELRHGSE